MKEWFEDLNAIMKVVITFTIVFFAVGAIWLAWTTVFTPLFLDRDRENFQRSRMHQDAVVQEFADNCHELATATDVTVHKAIVAVIAQRASVENIDALQMNDSVRLCVNEAVREYASGSK